MRVQDRPRSTNGDIEARRRARGRIAVEEHGHLVAGRVLELLDHQRPAARGRGPVHHAQRLAFHVLAHAVQLETARPSQQEASAVLGVRAALGEKPVEANEARIDDERLRLALRQLAVRERERILDGEPDRLEGVAAARDPPQLVAAGEAFSPHAKELDAALGEPPGPFVCNERRRSDCADGLDDEVDADVIAFDDVARRAVPADARRPCRQAHPGDGERHGQHEPGRDGIERARPEGPRGEVDDDAEDED